jgi:hypothetical protein
VLFENHLLRSKVNYQFSRSLSFRVIVDYNRLAGNPLLVIWSAPSDSTTICC